MASTDLAARQIEERLKALNNLVHEIENERYRTEKNLNNLTKLQDKTDDRSCQQKLNALYAALSDDEVEENLLRKALAKIYEIRSIQDERRFQLRSAGNKETVGQAAMLNRVHRSAQTLKLWIGKPDEKPPPLCGAIPPEPNYISKPGDLVAAFVKITEENWILAEVASFNSSTNKYEVYDIDEGKEKHSVCKRKVIPLPLMRANPETDPQAFFPKGSIVMALYPQTTCFYKAIITELPSTSTEQYELLFEDFNYPNNFSPPFKVLQRYVIAMKGQKSKG